MFMHFAPSNGTHAGVCDPNGHVVLRVLPRSLAQVCSLRNMSSRRLRFSVLTGLVSILSRSAEAGSASRLPLAILNICTEALHIHGKEVEGEVCQLRPRCIVPGSDGEFNHQAEVLAHGMSTATKKARWVGTFFECRLHPGAAPGDWS